MKYFNKSVRAAACTSVAALCAACGDPLVDPSELRDLRILTSKLQNASDDSASLSSAGSGEVSFLVAAPSPIEFFAYSALCESADSTYGPPACTKVLDARRSIATTETPVVVPIDLEPGWQDADPVVWIGLCITGKPKFHSRAPRFTCPDGAAATSAFVRLRDIGSDNRNPDLAQGTLNLDGAPWPQDSRDCETAPKVAPGAEVVIDFSANSRDLEHTGSTDYGSAEQETLTFLHVTSQPGLKRPFSVAGSQERGAFEVAYRAPDEDELPALPAVVDFYLIARDGRGGSDWLQRTLCIAR